MTIKTYERDFKNSKYFTLDNNKLNMLDDHAKLWMVQHLIRDGFVTLNDMYELYGFSKTVSGITSGITRESIRNRKELEIRIELINGEKCIVKFVVIENILELLPKEESAE